MKPAAGKIAQKIVQLRDYRSVAIVESFFPRSFWLKSHPHPDACLGVVLTGRYMETLRGRASECLPGVIRYLPAEHEHALSLEGSGRGILFQVKPATLERLRDYTVFDPSAGALRGDTLPLTQKLISEYRHNDEATPLAVECLVLELLIDMNRARRLPGVNASPALLRARDLLHEHGNGQLNLVDLAREVGIHPVHLSRQFPRVFHYTMSEYRRNVMIRRAQAYLADTEIPLNEISQLCGFHDQSHFTRCLKKTTGVTPLEYRRLARHKSFAGHLPQMRL